MQCDIWHTSFIRLICDELSECSPARARVYVCVCACEREIEGEGEIGPMKISRNGFHMDGQHLPLRTPCNTV